MKEENKLKIFHNIPHDIISRNRGKTEIKVIKYNKEHFKEEPFVKCPQIEENEITWVKVTHISEDESLKELFKCFKLDENLLKNILRIDYIPEIEDYRNYVYFQLTAFYIKRNSRIKRIQVSIILGENYVISLHHDNAGMFNTLINKLKIPDHQIGGKGADYLAYAIMGSIFDTHITTLKEIEGQISKEAEIIMDNPSDDVIKIIHSYRVDLDRIRQYILPLQQIMDSMELSETHLIEQTTSTFLKNFRSHITQITARIDTLSNRITELRDIYNSSMSRKLDQTVRILTVVTVIFAPLTFLVGLYGMNFKFMPELHHPFAYPVVLIINLVIGVGMLIYFKKKDWI